MNPIPFKKGDFVTNPKVPGWGTGLVIEVRDESNVLVVFQLAGEKLVKSQYLCVAPTPAGGSVLTPIPVGSRPRKSSTNEALNAARNDPNYAKEVISRHVASRIYQEVLLSQLLTSVGIANDIAPSAWAVTLFDNGFRLNVGPVEAVIFGDGILRVNMIGSRGVGPITGHHFETCEYARIYGPQCAYRGTIADYAPLRESLASAHAEFVRRASTRESGSPREGSTWAHSHSEGLILYAQMMRDGQS